MKTYVQEMARCGLEDSPEEEAYQDGLRDGRAALGSTIAIPAGLTEEQAAAALEFAARLVAADARLKALREARPRPADGDRWTDEAVTAWDAADAAYKTARGEVDVFTWGEEEELGESDLSDFKPECLVVITIADIDSMLCCAHLEHAD